LRIRASKGPLEVLAIAGTRCVLIAMKLPEEHAHGLLGVASPSGADFRWPAEDTKIRPCLAFLSVIGDQAHLCGNGERANGPNVAVLDRDERSDHGHGHLFRLLSCRLWGSLAAALVKPPAKARSAVAV